MSAGRRSPVASDSDAAAPRQTQTDNDASGNPQCVAGRPPLPSVQVTVLHLMGQKGFGTAPTDADAPRQIHEMNAVRRSQMAVRRGLADRKEITANGLVRRGRPEGVPLVRFDHSLFKYNGRFLRITSHKQRATLFQSSLTWKRRTISIRVIRC